MVVATAVAASELFLFLDLPLLLFAIDPDVTRYLEDVEDHLNLFLEEVSRIIGVCNSLRDEVNSYRDRQQQKVLYVLTLVTTLVMPTHLLTGIFGMNWQDEAGQPVVPGFGVMAEKRGYYLFWVTAHSFGPSNRRASLVNPPRSPCASLQLPCFAASPPFTAPVLLAKKRWRNSGHKDVADQCERRRLRSVPCLDDGVLERY
eukprot:s4810_g5.t1